MTSPSNHGSQRHDGRSSEPEREPSGRPEGAKDESFAALLHRSMVSYWPNISHALVHFMAVFLAFILYNVFAAHETRLKDLGGEIAVLTALSQEVNTLTDRTRALADQAQRAKQVPPPSAITPSPQGKPAVVSPCPGALSFQAPLWRSISTSERVLLIEEPLLQKIRDTYAELLAAPDTSRRMECEEFISGTLVPSLQSLMNDPVRYRKDCAPHCPAPVDIPTTIGRAKREWDSSRSFTSESMWRLFAAIALFAWLILLLWPPVSSALGAWKKQRAVHPAAAVPPQSELTVESKTTRHNP